MSMRSNRLKQALEQNRVVIGCTIDESTDLGIVRAIAAGGADFVFIDLEHRPFDLRDAFQVIWHAEGAGLSSVVRIPEVTYSWVQRILDAGCQNLIVPHVRSVEDLNRARQLGYYAPRGSRGMGLYGGASSDYTPVPDASAFTAFANDELLLGLLVETPEAVEGIDELLVTGIGFALVGFADLAQEYGIAGQHSHPLIDEARAKVREACQRSGVIYTAAVGTQNAIRDAVRAGSKMIMYRGVVSMVYSEVHAATQTVREALDEGISPLG